MAERARKRPPREETPEELLASTGVVLCPYCKGALVEGTLAGACEGCNTLHHVSCFAQHRGCSTHGCASTRAASLRVGTPPAADFPRLSCAVCKVKIEPHVLVAKCACGRTLDTNCFETIGSCGEADCKRPVGLLGHAEAVAARARRDARALTVAGLAGFTFALAVVGVAWTTKTGFDGALGALGVAGFFALSLFKLAWNQRKVAVSAERLPAPRPPGEGREQSK